WSSDVSSSDLLGITTADVDAACDGSRHAASTLTDRERTGLATSLPDTAPQNVRADVPSWLLPELTSAFGNRLIEEGIALAERAPVDLRANTLCSTREKVLEALAPFKPATTPWSPLNIRIAAPVGAARTPNVENEGTHGLGWFEVQDEGSQIAAALLAAKPGDKVLDLCAGAGGKSLAIAARMRNEGRILAYDSDKSRLRPIYERIARARATCIEPLVAGDATTLESHHGSCDAVLVDAPCSGTGTWRRKPDAKWRLKPEALDQRRSSQKRVLSEAAAFVRPGGRLVYVTCSLLPSENTAQVSAFLASNPGFTILPWRTAWTTALPTAPPPRSADDREDSMLLSPASHATDGFFVAVLQRR
ncbi:MAG TPA: RsmB/NOP family class I SAM-dependent RNA methyltransferase, partial [Hyphomicrobiaceae bacterium]|nr:RsmB/NOP family class I SAM-dependent RNA methyltransferase [Hyphomicrobiaceae bacterium]